MADSIQRSDSIDSSGFPLGFKVAHGGQRPGVIADSASRDIFRVELRAMGGHQKEAVVTEGSKGSSFRAVSDEGPGLNGTDLAPNPLSFFAAALPADIMNRFMQIARAQAVQVTELSSEQTTVYAFEGSLMKGDGKGSAQNPRVKLKLKSVAPVAQLQEIARAALLASPLAALCRVPLENTFALYANGRRRAFAALTSSPAPDATDPLKVWKAVPAPLDPANDVPGMLAKLGPIPTESLQAPQTDAAGRRLIRMAGSTRWCEGTTESRIRSSASVFGFKSDERMDDANAPCALSIGAWGIGFCLTTQFLRYADFHKMKIRAVRMVQTSPFEIAGSAAAGTLRAIAHPLDTHIFLHGEESDERMEKLLLMAQNTCFLHALLAAPLEPALELEINGAFAGI